MASEEKISENNEIDELINNLGSKNGRVRLKSREKLVSKGKEVVKRLMEQLDNSSYRVQWEAMKSLEEIGDPETIPIFINALENDESEIRWLAAEGLINTGMECVAPLLKTLLDKSESNSIFVYAGAHHVFHELKKENLFSKELPIDRLLCVLKNPGWTESLNPIVFKVLNGLPLESRIDLTNSG